MADDIVFTLAEGVATITLNRPDRRNAFTDAMLDRWIAFLAECASNDEVRVVIVTGAGSAFCSGGDIGTFAAKADRTPIEIRDQMTTVTHALVRAMMAFDKPLIAAVNGVAVGGGMDVAMMCDIRLATASARFAETYGKMGLLPGLAGTWFLPRLIGTAAALDLFWTSRWIAADEALTLGIVNRVLPDDSFAHEVSAYATSIARAAPLSVRFAKRLTYQAMETTLPVHLEALAASLALVRTSQDHKDAVSAFRERRTPTFTGR